MKFLYCTFNISQLERVTDSLEALHIGNYQIINEVPAKSMLGAPRMNTSVWPGHNAVLLSQFASDGDAAKCMEALKKLNEEAENEAGLITACTWEMTDYFFE